MLVEQLQLDVCVSGFGLNRKASIGQSNTVHMNTLNARMFYVV